MFLKKLQAVAMNKPDTIEEMPKKLPSVEVKELPTLESLKKEFEGQSNKEEKLYIAVTLMEASLAQKGTPNFKTFWEARKLCLELFKENISPGVRAIHWSRYRELTDEAKRLKEILEEQTAFHVEQIDLAIQALEKETEEMETMVANASIPSFPKGCSSVKGNLSKYATVQQELTLLNAHATRINGLRKELIRTEMRIRQKNQFFQKLSAAGNSVFPRRKALIKQVSDLFIEDVEAFVKNNFSSDPSDRGLFQFRDEIKALQAMAKVLTLNTHAFTQTRMKLSECWDKLKELDKEKKKEFAHQKEEFKKNAEQVVEKIKALQESFEEEPLSSHESLKKIEEISSFMRTIELGRDEVKQLRNQLSDLQKPFKDQIKEEENKRRQVELEKEEKRQEKIREIEESISSLQDTLPSIDKPTLEEHISNLTAQMEELTLSSMERKSLKRLFVPLQDALVEKQEEELLKLPKETQQAIKQLKEVLQLRQERRLEIKEHIEKLRKACGSSGLDFEQSLNYNQQLNTEKDRLEKINQSIEEIESQIVALK